MITDIQTIWGTHFSANIPDLVVAITEESAKVVMKIDDEEIYNETLFPIGGKLEVTDLSTLVEPYVRQKLKCQLYISVEEVQMHSGFWCDVVYSKADVSTTCEDFCESHFLSTLIGRKTTAVGRLEYLHYIGTEAASVVALYQDMSTKTFQLTPVGGNDKYTTIDVSPAQFLKEGAELISYEVKAGNRSQSFDVDATRPDCAPVLLFVNSFGVEELLYCTGTHKIAPDRKRDTMYVRQYMRTYNIDETRAMTADTGILSFEEAMWAEDLFRSEQVRLVTFVNGAPNVGKEIIITEDKAERTNDNDTLPRFTFTYHLAQRNHNVLELQREGRIFDNTFDNTFN